MSTSEHHAEKGNWGGKLSFNLKPMSEKRNVQWDEETIAEHDKERGTRQKIDEPPTPFHIDDDDYDDLDLYKNDHKFSSDEDDECKPIKSGDDIIIELPSRVNKVQPPSITFSLADNWSELSATLAYHHQAQLERDSRELGAMAINTVTTAESVRMSGNSNEIKEKVNTSYLSDSTATDVQQSSVDFKNKRNKHYNEYLIVKAANSKIQQDEGDDL